MFNKILLLLIKYIPIIQMLAMLLNNTLYYFTDNNIISYILDFLFGDSLIFTIFLLFISIRLNYCEWHRIIIIGNIINILIALIDIVIKIPCNDMQLIVIYYIVSCIFIIFATYVHIKHIKNESKIKNIKKFITNSY